MTFLEAAVEVLRRAGKPLPVREIADLAIRHELLTHVGRDPEGTMKARLEAELVRPPALARVRAVRPLVFALTEAGASLPPRSKLTDAAPPKAGERGRRRKTKRAAKAPGTEGSKADAPEPSGPPALPAVEAAPAGEQDEGEPRGRRRRRRGGRRTKSDAEGRSSEPAAKPRAAKEPGRSPGSPSKVASRSPAGPSARDGILLADAAYRILHEHADKRPMHYRQIAEMAVKRRLVPPDLADPRAAIRAALLYDQRAHRKAGLRPRFSGGEGGLFGLAGAKLSEGLVEAEEGVVQAARRLNERTREALLARLREVPLGAAEHLLRLALAQRGGQEPSVVEREPGFAVYRGGGAESGTVVRFQQSAPDKSTLFQFGERCKRETLRGVFVTLTDVPRELAASGLESGVQILGGPEFCNLLVQEGVGVFRAALALNYLDEELLAGLTEP